VDLAFDIEEPLPRILADEQLVDDLFSNLIANAVKYTPPHGSVRVALALDNSKWVSFIVRDTGIGIPGEEIGHLFEEFFRSANARQFVEEGTGLGLVVVKEILDHLKGTISVQSTLGEGTCFTCRLPISDRPSNNEDD
jgi:signal transduction histidine kinase